MRLNGLPRGVSPLRAARASGTPSASSRGSARRRQRAGGPRLGGEARRRQGEGEVEGGQMEGGWGDREGGWGGVSRRGEGGGEGAGAKLRACC